jgi:hypothetical protein
MKLLILLLAIYFLLVAGIVTALLKVRENTLASLNTPKAQADWDAYKADTAKQTGETTPVKRTAPQTAEPPTLVLMRDHFAAVLLGLLLPATALYAFTAWIVTGVVRQSRNPVARNEPHLTEP